MPSCSLIDRTPLVPTGTLDLGAVRRFLAQVVLEAIRADGRSCLYAQRTAENSEAFSAIFATLKIGPDDEAAVRAYAPLSPPGWLAWARDDFFHADAASSIDLSCRLLSQFAEGSSECVICLERILDPPQAPGSSPSSTCTWNTVCAATAPPSLVLLRVSHRGTRAVSAGLALRKRFALALSTRGLAAVPFDAWRPGGIFANQVAV